MLQTLRPGYLGRLNPPLRWGHVLDQETSASFGFDLAILPGYESGQLKLEIGMPVRYSTDAEENVTSIAFVASAGA